MLWLPWIVWCRWWHRKLVEESDISTIRDFYNQYKKSYDTPLCWDCALFRVLGYTEKYDDKRNGWFSIELLSLDMMYPQIIFHCIDPQMMDFGSETLFRSSVCDAVLWIQWVGVLLSLDILYLNIISHYIDDDMVTFDYETMFRSSVGGLMMLLCVWCRLRNWRYSKVYTTTAVW